MEVTVRVLLEFTGEARLAMAVYVLAATYLGVNVLRILASAWSPASRD
jgi:hypothetical protein